MNPTCFHINYLHCQDRGLSSDSYLTKLDLFGTYWLLCSGSSSRALQLIRKCHKSHICGIGAILILDGPALSLNTVSCDKKKKSHVATALRANGQTNFNRFDIDKKNCRSFKRTLHFKFDCQISISCYKHQLVIYVDFGLGYSISLCFFLRGTQRRISLKRFACRFSLLVRRF